MANIGIKLAFNVFHDDTDILAVCFERNVKYIA